MTTEQTKFLVNGEKTDSISVTDRGLQFGDGVFETIRIHQGKPVWWQQHINRLLDGCHRLRFADIPDIDTLRQEVTALASDCVAGVLKIIITRGCSNSGYATPADTPANRILCLTPGMRHQSRAGQGIVMGVCSQHLAGHDSLSGIKHLNRLEQVLARIQCQGEGWDEGIMLDEQSAVIEGTMSNLFIWQENLLLTPSLQKTGIKGLCREIIIALAEENGIAVDQTKLRLEDLTNSSGIFVTNSLIGIWPVINFNHQQLTVCANTRLLQEKLEDSICSAD
ncbi:MAG: aminodeoxychorismate lyase [Gammaproteobacteria bacterium]|nr:MAG: aminodeoxychorismate lyase [Gammaproteobacteria bacterium]